MNYFSTGFCLFVSQQGLKKPCSSTCVPDKNHAKKKYSLETERKETEHFIAKKLITIKLGLYGKRAGNFFWRNLHHRLQKYFKEQLRTFLERNECSPHNINHRYVLTYVF